MTDDLSKILAAHCEWADSGGGSRADLMDAYLTGAYLMGAYLTRANLRGANLTDANLRGANLMRADLRGANFMGANLRGANLMDAYLMGAHLTDAHLTDAYLTRANLRGANLTDANLRGANLTGANLRGANLTRANLTDANLTDADLTGAHLTDAHLTDASGVDTAKWPAFFVCPDFGAFTAWKKLRDGVLAELIIPAEAKRTSAVTSRKCRAEFAQVVALTDRDGESVAEGLDMHRGYTRYAVGEIVRPDSYDPRFTTECSNGIHFWITRAEAVAYNG